MIYIYVGAPTTQNEVTKKQTCRSNQKKTELINIKLMSDVKQLSK